MYFHSRVPTSGIWCYVSLLDLEHPSPLSPQDPVGAEKTDFLNEDKREPGILPHTKAIPGALAP